MRFKIEECKNTRVILIRHGESTYNSLGLYQGSSDESVLTSEGRHMAHQTGTLLSGLSFDAVYVSSLQRAQQTAKEMLAVMTPKVDLTNINILAALRENDMPAWHGLPFKYVKENFAADYQCWKQSPHKFRMEIPCSGEETAKQYCYPALDLYERIQQFWQEVLPRHQGQTILIIAHGGTNRALISTAIGVTPDHYHGIEQSNCGISILNFPKGTKQPAKLEAINLSSHVSTTLPKIKDGGLRLLLLPAGKINSKQIQRISQLLKETTINFSINGALDNSQICAQEILYFHPETVRPEVLREDFPEIWQQTIKERNPISKSRQLTTGLVIACDTVIKRLLGQVLGMNSDQILQFQLHEGAISSIYYPDTNHPPMLQTINASAYEKELIFGSSSQPTLNSNNLPVAQQKSA